MPKYKILEIRTIPIIGDLYVLVDFWLNSQNPLVDTPHQQNDFVLDIAFSNEGVKKDVSGNYVKLDGTTIDPAIYGALDIDDRQAITFQKQINIVDVRTSMINSIETYWAKQLANIPLNKNRSNKENIVRDTSDVRGILSQVSADEGVLVNTLLLK